MPAPLSPFSRTPLRRVEVHEGGTIKSFNAAPHDKQLSLSIEAEEEKKPKPAVLLLLVFIDSQRMVLGRLHAGTLLKC